MHGPFPEALGQDTVLEFLVFVLQEEDVRPVAQHPQGLSGTQWFCSKLRVGVQWGWLHSSFTTKAVIGRKHWIWRALGPLNVGERIQLPSDTTWRQHQTPHVPDLVPQDRPPLQMPVPSPGSHLCF